MADARAPCSALSRRSTAGGDDVQMPRRRGARDVGRGSVDQLAEPGLLVVARPPARRPSAQLVEVGQLHAQDRRLELVQARVVADLLVGDLVVGAVEAQRARALGDCSSEVVIMPPSPKQPRFLEGKNENVAAVPSAPGRAGRRRSEPAAWAASSSTGTPSASISATGATLPNRCTAITAFVRGVSAARTVSAVTQ